MPNKVFKLKGKCRVVALKKGGWGSGMEEGKIASMQLYKVDQLSVGLWRGEMCSAFLREYVLLAHVTKTCAQYSIHARCN